MTLSVLEGAGGGRSKLRILHVITTLADGGAEAVLYRLVTADTQHAHVVVSLMDAGKYGPLLVDAGVPVYALGMPRGRVSLRGCRQLWTLLRTLDVAVVQTWMYHADVLGGLAARLAGKRGVVWGLHNTGVDQFRTFVVARACATLSCWVPRRIISCSARATSIHRSLGYVGEKMATIPNGYDLTSFSADRQARSCLRAAWGIPHGGMVLGMVARWHPQKDHANLAQALARVGRGPGRGWWLVLVGPGMVASNQALVQLLRTCGILDRTLLLGQRRDIAGVMSALDVHLLSSSAEAFPNVVAEAMACETPCVVTDAGDAGSIVGDTGWVAPPRDPTALAAAIESAMLARLNEADWATRQLAARERIAKHFSLDRMIRAYSQVWLEVAVGTS